MRSTEEMDRDMARRYRGASGEVMTVRAMNGKIFRGNKCLECDGKGEHLGTVYLGNGEIIKSEVTAKFCGWCGGLRIRNEVEIIDENSIIKDLTLSSMNFLRERISRVFGKSLEEIEIPNYQEMKVVELFKALSK